MRPEILSPCGGPESVTAALAAGADAVYLGAKNFSARHNAVNFSDDELKAAVRECHRHGVLVYLAVNTMVFTDELEALADTLALACEAAVDGLIIQDMAVYEMVRQSCPDMPVHASTQMTLHTRAGAEAAKELGFSRVVAARELSIEAIRQMCDTGIEVEAFAHGALCMCVSGQCYLSAMIGGRSANRGLCAGACRLPFSADGNARDKYALSLKDLSYCSRVKVLEDIGVKSLKIEGRMKRPEYVAAATDAMRKAIDGEKYDEDILRAVFSRSGFTDGYLDGKLGAEMFGARGKEDVTAAADALPKLRKIYEKPRKRFTVDMRFSAAVGDKMSLWLSDGKRSVTVEGDAAEAARNRETAAEEIRAQLSKLGGTIYEVGSVEVECGGGTAIPLSKINDLRRRGLQALDEARIAEFAPKSFEREKLQLYFPMPLMLKYPQFRVRVERIEQLEKLPTDELDIVIPLCEAEKFVRAGYSPERAVIALPRFDVDEKATVERLKIAKSLGFGVVECGNIGQIKLVRDLGMTPQGGFGLNIANPMAARHYFDEGVKTLTVSPELKAWQTGTIAYPAKAGAVLYGRLPLMITRNCPIEAQVGCRNCTKMLTDRTGAEFPILCRRELGYIEILNSRAMWLSDKISDFNLDFGDLWFTVETADEAAKVYEKYREGAKPTGEFTRGLYYRGVE